MALKGRSDIDRVRLVQPLDLQAVPQCDRRHRGERDINARHHQTPLVEVHERRLKHRAHTRVPVPEVVVRGVIRRSGLRREDGEELDDTWLARVLRQDLIGIGRCLRTVAPLASQAKITFDPATADGRRAAATLNGAVTVMADVGDYNARTCLLYTSPSPRD